MAGSIKFDGISSGIPTDEMLTKLVEAEKFQAKKLESWKSEWEEKVDVLLEVNKKMATVTTAMETLSTEKTFYAKTATTSNSTVASVATDTTSTNGSYNMEVASSTKHIIASKGFIDSDTTPIATQDPATPGVFSFDDGSGNIISVNIDNTMTMENLRDVINTEANNQGSSSVASIINDGTPNGYRMQIMSDSAGEGSDVVFSSDDSLLSFTTSSIDDVETSDFSGTSAISSSGSYTGHVNKRINYEVSKGGTLGTDNIEVKWSDPVEDKSGTITINASTYDPANSFLIEQGISLNFGAGTLDKGDLFAVDVFSPTIQQAQDSGLAKTEKEVHSGFVDSDTTAVALNAAGSLTYSYAGETIAPLQIPKGSTLQDLADIINEDASNPGITATIINDGTGKANAYHLVLTANDAGSANKIENISHTLDNFASVFEETQKGQNAMYKLNDYPNNDEYLQSSSNLITNAIQGVSINIESEGSTNITIGNDVDEMTSKVQEFVDSYNEAMDYLNEITEIVTDENGEASYSTSGILTGNYGVNMLKSDNQLFITERPIGYEDGTDPFLLLSQLGITTGDDSKLEFDEEVLKTQLREKPEEIVDYFTADKTGSTDSSYVRYLSGTSLTQAGEYEVEVTYKSDASGDVESGRYREKGEDTWYNMAVGSNNSLTAMKGDAIGMAVTGIWDGSSTTMTTDLRVKEGKAHQYLNRMDEILDENTGITKVLVDNYENIIENIEDKITRELSRVAQVEARYQDQFARLEVLMSESNAQQEQLQQQLSSLPS